MYGEINRNNLPPELTLKIFLQFVQEGFKDPVLKNYLILLDLVQKALPIYFRYLQPDVVKSELVQLVKNTIAKTSDLKAKVREASINFCLYLSHQSPIGPEVMINQVIEELGKALKQKPAEEAKSSSTASFGSSHLISSCLQLLNQFQQQTKLVDQMDTFLFNKYMECVNEALRHTNPIVRKQGEGLFKTLYMDFGEGMNARLVDQKPALVQKLSAEAKQEAAQSKSDQVEPSPNMTSTSFGSRIGTAGEEGKGDKLGHQRTLMQLQDNFTSMPQIRDLVDG